MRRNIVLIYNLLSSSLIVRVDDATVTVIPAGASEESSILSKNTVTSSTMKKPVTIRPKLKVRLNLLVIILISKPLSI